MTIAVVLLGMNCWPQLTRVKGIALYNNPTRAINPQSPPFVAVMISSEQSQMATMR